MPKKDNIDTSEMKVRKRGVRFIRTILVLFLLLIGTSLFVQIPAVQTWGAKRIAAVLSKNLNTQVSLSGFRFKWFRDLSLKDLYLEDLQGDTLLYSANLDVDFDRGLWALIRKDVRIRSLSLGNGQLKIKTYHGDTLNNFQRVFLNLNQASEQPSGDSKIFVDLKSLNLNRVNVSFVDENNSSFQNYRFDRLSGTFDSLFVNENRFYLRKLNLVRPEIEIESQRFSNDPSRLEEDETKIDNKSTHSSAFTIKCKTLIVDDGCFNMIRHPIKGLPQNTINWRDLGIYDFDGEFVDIHLTDTFYTTRVTRFHLLDKSGFELQEGSAEYASFSQNKIELLGIQLETPNSIISDSITLSYSDPDALKDFENRVFIEAQLNGAFVDMEDIAFFSPGFRNDPFYIKNRNRRFFIDGNIKGRINGLHGDKMTVYAEPGLKFLGDFSLRNVTQKGSEFLRLQIDQLETDVNTLESIVPNVEVPESFNKLGRFSFEGNFYGLFQDFVSFGTLYTDLGKADLDMRLDLKPGVESAEYSGKLDLHRFRLNEWMDSNDFGMLSMKASVRNGKGLTIDHASANLEMRIDSLEFRDHPFKDIKFDGQLNQDLFDGQLLINDPDFKMNFIGNVTNISGQPEFDFVARIDTLNLHLLNISEEEIGLSGRIHTQLSSLELDDLEGFLQLDSVRMTHRGKKYQLSKILARQIKSKKGSRTMTLESDFAELVLEGDYHFRGIEHSLYKMVHSEYPGLASRFQIPRADSSKVQDLDFILSLQISDSETYLDLLKGPMMKIKGLDLNGRMNSKKNEIDLSMTADHFVLDANRFSRSRLRVNSANHKGVANLLLDSVIIANQELRYIELENTLENQQVLSFLTMGPQEIGIDTVSLIALSSFPEEFYQLEFFPSFIQTEEDMWMIPAGGRIKMRNKELEVRDLKFLGKEAEIAVKSISKDQLRLQVADFDFGFINDLLKDPKFDFQGKLDVDATISHLFDVPKAKMETQLKELTINGDPYGNGTISSTVSDKGKMILLDAQIEYPGRELSAEGIIDMRRDESQTDVDIFAKNYPLSFLEYIIPNGISGTEGNVDVDFKLYGQGRAINLMGDLLVHQGKTTVDYLGVEYAFENQLIKFNRDGIDFTGAVLKDKFGNEARVLGTLPHRLDDLRDFGLDLRIVSDRILVLNTTREQNPNYFGQGIGKADVRFTGDFERTDIEVIATTGRGTSLSIPVDYGGSGNVSNSQFVNFVEDIHYEESKESPEGTSRLKIKGLNFYMDLDVNENAEVKIIFDESAGDIISGTGRGDIQLSITRKGDFNVYGTYEIENGNYLYTYNILSSDILYLNKPFSIQRGGTIRWNGDPFGAQIDVAAKYTEATSSLTSFLSGLALSDRAIEEAKKNTPVHLTMYLTGLLYRPNIRFELDFVDVPSELRSYIDSRIRQLNADPNALNQQVFGLLMMGTLLPPSNATASGQTRDRGFSIGFNTVSEFISTQLSRFASNLLSDVIGDGEVLESIEVDFGYHQFEDEDAAAGQGEYRFLLKNKLWNDQWIITLGGNYASESSFYGTSYFTPQGIVEWNTPVPGLKLRVFYLTDRFPIIGFKNEVGAGVRFRKEYDSFFGLKKGIKELNEQNGQ